jgi:hypothetical protein
MIEMIVINREPIPQALMCIKGITGVRIAYDDDGCPFSYHAMSSETQEIGYIIPEMFKFSGVSYVNRTWGDDTLSESDWVAFSY